MDFFEELMKEIIGNIDHNYTDNYDFYRFGPDKAVVKKSKTIKQYIVHLINEAGYYNLSKYKEEALRQITGQLKANHDAIKNCGQLFDMLGDEHSKKLLVELLCYAMMGHTKVKLPLSTADYWQKIKAIEALQDKSDFVPTGFLDFVLYKTNLNTLGYPIQFYYTAMGIMTTFAVKQYEYKWLDNVVKAEKGDTVIDAGACWGDTALYFASEVGPGGLVYSFEFIPTNINIFNKNVDLNSSLKKVVNLVNAPLWDTSDKQVFYRDNGPGSKVSFTREKDLNGESRTITIDDWVKRDGINKIDFIKMDIEGAEMNALYGAEETIRKFKPKLAICIYHQWLDFGRIADWLNKLGLGYRFYLTHNTINLEETVLFAKSV